ncbi:MULTISPECIES: tyrosine-protein phosphatase [Streptomyces]|uniref:Tyrosine-protein phosphatase n=2 Tax=Streptomyces TaxID=1883 RepID=A0ABY9JGV9_9ACTN|nr:MULTISPECIES: tyrosine-protein phosphatase [unclassified Streptomyces]TXS07031.1 tyrosine-protein phosphatase [Streptomyces sp. wa22]WSQ79641.1 tyrosine-protein phosphatase [Streptomyces sp. NBC_01213]WLQ66199.1 tyrosine-protein phosphatase [Streptomyces sp. Alt3]WSQ87021.1 tyrosine-protein phosphatase [Streptomyces sp. NBC_01212]WSR06959.1 tyrosine-protein phosphatase [Streptomyces sp. NBC_01208]
MTHMTRARVSSCALAAAFLVGITAPAASAHHAHAGQAQGSHTRIPFTEAEVTASDDGSYTVEWKAPGIRHVAVRANGRTVASGGSTGKVTVRGLPAADRQWFDLVPERGGRLHLADRLIALEGAVNFRDAGGYRTADGHWVKMGEIYRSDALDKLTTADLAKLRRLSVRTVYDLRTESERSAAPDRVPAGATHVVADVLAGSPTFTAMPTTPEEGVAMMVEGEKFMVSGDTAKTAYRTVFGGITDDSSHAVVFHCTAGKDRTGWANAALLTALGVPRATVMADYLASNDYRAEANAAALASMPAAQAAVYKPLLDVRPEYLNSGFDEVRERFGSFGGYEKKALGLDAGDVRDLKRDLLVG